MPPLRERTEDIIDLVRHFLGQAQREGLPAKQFEPAALERLKRHNWPGNVRELENLMRRLAALFAYETITRQMLETELQDRMPYEQTEGPPVNLSEYTEQYLSDYFGGYGEKMPPPGLYNRILAQVEVPLINAALVATAGNQIKAAELLGINRNTLRKKIRDHDITVVRGVTLKPMSAS